MKFQQAIQKLREGKKVRRNCWDEKYFYVLKNEEIYSGLNVKAHLTFNAMEGEDWELYEEKKEKRGGLECHGEDFEITMKNGIVSLKLLFKEPKGVWGYDLWAEKVLDFAKKNINKYPMEGEVDEEAEGSLSDIFEENEASPEVRKDVQKCFQNIESDIKKAGGKDKRIELKYVLKIIKRRAGERLTNEK